MHVRKVPKTVPNVKDVDLTATSRTRNQTISSPMAQNPLRKNNATQTGKVADSDCGSCTTSGILPCGAMGEIDDARPALVNDLLRWTINTALDATEILHAADTDMTPTTPRYGSNNQGATIDPKAAPKVLSPYRILIDLAADSDSFTRERVIKGNVAPIKVVGRIRTKKCNRQATVKSPYIQP